MNQDDVVRMATEAGFGQPYIGAMQHELKRFSALVAAHARETHRLPKMTEDQIWKCNNDGDGGVHICIEHQNVVDFARAIEREIGFARAELMLTRIKAAIAAEREACAKVCEDYTDNARGPYPDHESHGYQCAAVIRARGENAG